MTGWPFAPAVATAGSAGCEAGGVYKAAERPQADSSSTGANTRSGSAAGACPDSGADVEPADCGAVPSSGGDARRQRQRHRQRHANAESTSDHRAGDAGTAEVVAASGARYPARRRCDDGVRSTVDAGGDAGTYSGGDAGTRDGGRPVCRRRSRRRCRRRSRRLTQEAKPAPMPEAKPAPTQEAKPAPVPEAKPATTQEAKPVTLPEAKPATTQEAKPVTLPEAKPAIRKRRSRQLRRRRSRRLCKRRSLDCEVKPRPCKRRSRQQCRTRRLRPRRKRCRLLPLSSMSIRLPNNCAILPMANSIASSAIRRRGHLSKRSTPAETMRRCGSPTEMSMRALRRQSPTSARSGPTVSIPPTIRSRISLHSAIRPRLPKPRSD